jgi:hypothetical protein
MCSDDVREALGVHRNRTWRACNTGVALVRLCMYAYESIPIIGPDESHHE